MKLKGLVEVNSYLSYQRSVPTDLRDHPTFEGKKLYKKKLGAKLRTEEEIHKAWLEEHKAFESLIANLRKANLPLIEARELAAEARNLLKAHGLKEGERSPDPLLSDEHNRNIEDATDLKLDHSGLLDEATEIYNKRESGEIDSHEEIPPHIQVADEAWKLLNTPKSEVKNQTILLSDCWKIYAEKKDLDLEERGNKKTLQRWNYFLEFAGDCVLDNSEIHDRLDRYVEYREQCRKDAIKAGKKPSPSSSTIHKEIDMACAIINQVVKLHRLQIRIVKPDIQKTEPEVREVLTPNEVIDIITLAQDTQTRFYKPWKELALLILAQTSCIASELKRLTKDSILLDQEVPVIKIAGEVKTKHRLRTIPLVYKVDRIKELIDTEQSELILGEVANTTESNLSRQLINLITNINPNATAYSFRHTFKHNAQLKDINPLHIAYLGGWSGSSLGLNEIMVNYGKGGMETPQMLLTLQNVMKKINSHLLETEPNTNNVVELRA